jgi:CHRD domain
VFGVRKSTVYTTGEEVMSTSKLTTGGHRRALLSAAVLGTAGALALGLASTAAADPGHSGHGGSEQQPASTSATPKPAKGPSTFLTANLTGDQEVPVPNGPAVADNDGAATALVQVKGDRVIFALRWKGIAAPSLGHIHEGKAGVNGGVKVTLFGTAMPDTVTAAAGQVTINDAQLAQDISRNPSGFYVNLHTAEFPGGAVRGQLKPASKRINPLEIIRGGKLRAPANGDQEVPAADGKAVGDPNGFAVSFLQPKGGAADYSLAWVNIGAPTLGHVHQGKFGQNGPVKVNLFTTPMPATVFAASGTVRDVDPAVAAELRRNPTGFYSNLHTQEFPGGAVRGQFLG